MYQFSASKILSFVCIFFALGVLVESFIEVPQFFLWAFLVSTLIFFVWGMIKKENLAFFIGLFILCVALGILRMQVTQFNIQNNPLSSVVDSGKITVYGVIVDEPDVRETQQKLKVDVLGGRVLVTTNKYPVYSYLNKIEINGKFEKPPIFDDFNYRDYLLKDGIYAVSSYPNIEVLSKNHDYTVYSFLYEKILFLKAKISISIQNNFSSSNALILEGIMLGNNKNMTDMLRQQLNVTGLRFLTAVSGTHIVIISAMMMTFLLSLGFFRNHAFILSIFIIWIYIILVGLPASGVRAGIMGSIFLVAQFFGRQNTSSRAILIAGALMMLQNPMLLTHDIGFQLSFLASFGIIYLKPALSALIGSLFKGRAKEIVDILAVTLSAQIFILPLLVYNFGTFSFVSIITSILILPVVPWILTLGFLFSIVEIFSHALAWIFYIPCWFLINYFLKVMDVFSAPWASKTFDNVSWIWVIPAYVLIILVTIYLRKRLNKTGIY